MCNGAQPAHPGYAEVAWNDLRLLALLPRPRLNSLVECGDHHTWVIVFSPVGDRGASGVSGTWRGCDNSDRGLTKPQLLCDANVWWYARRNLRYLSICHRCDLRNVLNTPPAESLMCCNLKEQRAWKLQIHGLMIYLHVLISVRHFKADCPKVTTGPTNAMVTRRECGLRTSWAKMLPICEPANDPLGERDSRSDTSAKRTRNIDDVLPASKQRRRTLW